MEPNKNTYTIRFKGMAHEGPDSLDINERELQHLIEVDLVHVQADKIRSEIIKELASLHSPRTQQID
jgi:hypothetical protein